VQDGSIILLSSLQKQSGLNEPVVKFSATDTVPWQSCPGFSAFGTETQVFLTKYDSNGNVLNIKRVYCGNSTNLGGLSSRPDQMCTDVNSNVYLLMNGTNHRVFDYQGNTNLSNGSHIIAFTSNIDTIKWTRALHPEPLQYNALKIKCGRDGNVYLASGIFDIFSFVFNGDTLQLPSNFDNITSQNNVTKAHMAIINPNGQIIHHSLINDRLKTYDVIFDIDAIDTNNIYVTGLVQDTI
jgi:hypothetical protein